MSIRLSNNILISPLVQAVCFAIIDDRRFRHRNPVIFWRPTWGLFQRKDELNNHNIESSISGIFEMNPGQNNLALVLREHGTTETWYVFVFLNSTWRVEKTNRHGKLTKLVVFLNFIVLGCTLNCNMQFWSKTNKKSIIPVDEGFFVWVSLISYKSFHGHE